MNNFQPLEVVGRGSETHLHVGENLNKVMLSWRIENIWSTHRVSRFSFFGSKDFNGHSWQFVTVK